MRTVSATLEEEPLKHTTLRDMRWEYFISPLSIRIEIVSPASEINNIYTRF